jgi:hypothetical protein
MSDQDLKDRLKQSLRSGSVDLSQELPLEGLEPEAAARARLKGSLRQAAAAAQEQVRAEREGDLTYMERFVPAAKVAIPAGAIVGGTMGGPGGALGGAAIGTAGAAIGALAEEEAEALGAGPVGQIAAGVGSEMFLTGPGVLRRLGKVGRASAELKRSGLLEGLPEPGAAASERAAETVRSGVQKLEDDVTRAYDKWRESLPGDEFGLPVERVQEALEDIAREGRWGPMGGDMGPIGKIRSQPESYLVTADDLNLIRREFNRVASTAYGSQDYELGRRATIAKKSIDELELELAQKTGGEESLRLLADARAKRAVLGEIIDEKGDRLVGRVVVNPRTRADNSQKAFHQIMTADRTMESLRQLRQAARIEGGARGVDLFDNDLRRVAVSYLFGRGPGATGAGSSQSAGAVLRKMEQNEKPLRSIFGGEGYDFIQRNLHSIDQSVKGGSLEPVVRTVETTKGLKNLLTWATLMGVGGAGAQAAVPAMNKAGALGAAAGATIGLGHMAIDAIGSHFGPIAARNVAIRALYDPRVYREVTRRVSSKESEATATLLMSQFAKRGVITAQDFATLEGEL